jgi:hypothetical protein
MAIYRGPGGSGDATNDASSETRLAVEARDAAIAAQLAAEAAEAGAVAAQAAAELAETNAETAETNAELAETNAETAEANAESAQAAAEAAQSAAEDAQTAAELAETNAETAASNASGFADDASDFADAAAASAIAAQTAETNAETAQAAAEAARDAALSAYDNFDDRYLGPKASDPTLDNDGNALITGALYFNTTSSVMKVYTGSAWVAAYVSAAGVLLAANNLSDLTNTTTARSNLGLGTAATTDATAYATAAQGTNADTAYGWGDHALVGYLTSYTETDPVFSVSEAASITSTDTSNWDTAYSWGNHATAGYLTSYIETDPVYTASTWYTTTNNATNWDTAYSWGNHASAGYLTSATAATTYVSLTGSYSNPSWITSLDDGKVLPSMPGNSGKYLTTDGTNSSWATVTVDADPAGTAVALAIALG